MRSGHSDVPRAEDGVLSRRLLAQLARVNWMFKRASWCRARQGRSDPVERATAALGRSW